MRSEKSGKKRTAFRTMREYRDYYYRDKASGSPRNGDKYYQLGVQSASLAMAEAKQPT